MCRFPMMVLRRAMHAFVIQEDFPIILPHGTHFATPLIDKRVPEACAYTYQSYPTSVKEGMPVSFPHGLGELNGGLQIFKPSREKFERIFDVLNSSAPGELLFADQSLLSKTFHGEWKPLYSPFQHAVLMSDHISTMPLKR